MTEKYANIIDESEQPVILDSLKIYNAIQSHMMEECKWFLGERLLRPPTIEEFLNEWINNYSVKFSNHYIINQKL